MLQHVVTPSDINAHICARARCYRPEFDFDGVDASSSAYNCNYKLISAQHTSTRARDRPRGVDASALARATGSGRAAEADSNSGSHICPDLCYPS